MNNRNNLSLNGCQILNMDILKARQEIFYCSCKQKGRGHKELCVHNE